MRAFWALADPQGVTVFTLVLMSHSTTLLTQPENDPQHTFVLSVNRYIYDEKKLTSTGFLGLMDRSVCVSTVSNLTYFYCLVFSEKSP